MVQLHERTHLYASDHYFWKHSKKIGEGLQEIITAGLIGAIFLIDLTIGQTLLF